ncbi:MAG: FKBP-type peptidyl-prolyl cis-trans isomerase [Pseudomonadales bacterium]
MTEYQLSLGSDEQKVSYGLGRQFGDQLAKTQIEQVDLAAVIAGLEQAFLGQPSVLQSDEMSVAYESIESKLQFAARNIARRNAADGEALLIRNAKRNGVMTTESGIQYEILVKGTGDKPLLSSVVRTHYHGTLVDGTVFDSSTERGEPTEFAVTGVIAGWTEALLMMPVGSKWRLHIPAKLAYGERGAGTAIPPNSILIFEIELLEIVS